MRLRHDIGVYTRQTTAITPQVIQSIRILQFGAAELDEYLRDQVERNPLIEVSEPAKDLARAAPSAGGGSLRSSGGSPAPTGLDNGLERYVAAEVRLQEHMTRQASLTFRDPAEQLIAAELIGSLEDDGYLRRDLRQIARRLGTEVARVEAVLARVQEFEPAGIAARDLGECLTLQLREKDRFDPAMARLIENLPMLAKYEMAKLARLCNVDEDDLREMVAEIRELDPRPGRRFDTAPTPPAFPDVVVRAGMGDAWEVELNSDLLPRVLVNRQYYAEIKAAGLTDEDKRFVVDCMKDATWLARNVDQRARTILNVATEIVAQQKDFLRRGVDHLRPLNLKDVADAVGVHVSTVCRAISNKYMMTDRGLFELRFFFSNSIASVDGGGECSSESVRHKIAALVQAETAKTVLSDEAIVRELRKSDIDIARRTVAKYRDILGIPPSLQRRRQKQAELAA